MGAKQPGGEQRTGTTLLLRLLDDQVIAVETEGESALEHSYKVVVTLEQVV